MKGFKHTGRGPKKGFSFPSKAGFSGSTGRTQSVKGYTRAVPKRKFADGGMVVVKGTDGGSALTRRTKPVTGFDAEAGGKGPLRPGFNKGGKACYAEGGKVGPLTAIAKYMKKGPANTVKKEMREAARKDIAEGGPGSKSFAEDTKNFYKEGSLSRDEYHDDMMMHKDNERLSQPPKAHKVQPKKKFAEGGKVGGLGDAIRMVKQLMAQGNSPEQAATKAARRFNVPAQQLKTPGAATGGGGMPADKQMLARGGLGSATRRVVGRAAGATVPSAQAQKNPPQRPVMAHHGYGSFGRRPLVG